MNRLRKDDIAPVDPILKERPRVMIAEVSRAEINGMSTTLACGLCGEELVPFSPSRASELVCPTPQCDDEARTLGRAIPMPKLRWTNMHDQWYCEALGLGDGRDAVGVGKTRDEAKDRMLATLRAQYRRQYGVPVIIDEG